MFSKKLPATDNIKSGKTSNKSGVKNSSLKKSGEQRKKLSNLKKNADSDDEVKEIGRKNKTEDVPRVLDMTKKEKEYSLVLLEDVSLLLIFKFSFL